MRTEQLTKCHEPLLKLRVRLGTFKIDLSPPVILYLILIVPMRYFCGGSFCFMSCFFFFFFFFFFFVCCWRFMYVFIFLVNFR